MRSIKTWCLLLFSALLFVALTGCVSAEEDTDIGVSLHADTPSLEDFDDEDFEVKVSNQSNTQECCDDCDNGGGNPSPGGGGGGEYNDGGSGGCPGGNCGGCPGGNCGDGGGDCGGCPGGNCGDCPGGNCGGGSGGGCPGGNCGGGSGGGCPGGNCGGGGGGNGGSYSNNAQDCQQVCTTLITCINGLCPSDVMSRFSDTAIEGCTYSCQTDPYFMNTDNLVNLGCSEINGFICNSMPVVDLFCNCEGADDPPPSSPNK